MTATSTVMSTVSSTVTSTSESTAMTMTMTMVMVSSTVETELVVDLEEAIMSQGDKDDNTYSKNTRQHLRTEQAEVRHMLNRKRSMRDKKWKEATEYAERQLWKEVKERQKVMSK